MTSILDLIAFLTIVAQCLNGVPAFITNDDVNGFLYEVHHSTHMKPSYDTRKNIMLIDVVWIDPNRSISRGLQELRLLSYQCNSTAFPFHYITIPPPSPPHTLTPHPSHLFG